MVSDNGNSWRGIIYEKLSPAAKLPHRGLNDAVQAATQAVAQGNNIASEALNTASQIMTAAQAVASEAINKLSLEIGAGISKACLVEAGKPTCVDYTGDGLRKVADMLSDASGNKDWATVLSTLSPFHIVSHIGSIMGYMLLIAISSFVAYLASIWSLHGARQMLLPLLTLFNILVTVFMLVMVLVMVYIRSKAPGPLEASPCLTDAIICFVASAVQSATSLAELLKGTGQSSPGASSGSPAKDSNAASTL